MMEAAAIGDHPVLDFLGTLRMVDGVLTDDLQSDADVLRVLAALGWPVTFAGRGLMPAAKELREEVRRLVERRRDGKALRLGGLNAFLEAGRSFLRIESAKGSLVLKREWESGTAKQALAPVAEAAAELLATGDFELVRRCEGEGCVLWFYDRTKSHRRRWCSMAACGNRHKVAAFRKRGSQG